MFECGRFSWTIVVCTILLAITGRSSYAQQLLWQRVFDTGVADQSMDVAADSQGNIIVVGTTITESINPPNYSDFLIVKYNPLGDTLWTRRFNADVYDQANGVAVDGEDNIIVVGNSYSSANYAVLKVVKYNADGNILWMQTYGIQSESTTVSGRAVTVDSRCNIVVAANKNSNWGDYLTLKYDSSGALWWIRTYDGGWEDAAQDVTVDDCDNVIVTGYSNSHINNWDWCTIQYSPEGDTLWVRRYDASLDDWAHGVATDAQGNIVVVGESRPAYRSRGTVVKYTPQGDTLWTKRFSDPYDSNGVETLVDVAVDRNGTLYLFGNYVTWDSTKTDRDYYVVKCTTSGDTLWTARYDNNVNDQASGIALDNSSSIVLTGTTEGIPDDPYRPIDFYTVKLHNVTDGVSQNDNTPHRFVLYPSYPNPFNASTTVQYDIPVSAHVSIVLYDLLGREITTLIDEWKQPGEYEMHWDAANRPSGVYFYRLRTSAGSLMRKMMLLK